MKHIFGTGDTKYTFLDMEKLRTIKIEDSSKDVAISRYDYMLDSGYIPTCVLKEKDGHISYMVFDIRRPPAEMPEYIVHKCQETLKALNAELDKTLKDNLKS